jgi:hypothetical protein
LDVARVRRRAWRVSPKAFACSSTIEGGMSEGLKASKNLAMSPNALVPVWIELIHAGGGGAGGGLASGE